MVGLLSVLSVLMILGGAALIALKSISHRKIVDEKRNQERYGRDDRDIATSDKNLSSITKKPKLIGGIVLVVVGLLFFIILTTGGGVTVGPNQIGVMENSLTGQYTVLNSGTYIWPFRKNTPFVTDVTIYGLEEKLSEAGQPPNNEMQGSNGLSLAQVYGIQADSNSPGRPIVYLAVKSYVRVNPDNIILLHRKYGKDYIKNWVNGNLVTAVKAAQGASFYDRVGKDRVGLANEAKTVFEKVLVGGDDKQLLYVSQVIVTDFDFTQEMNRYLDTIVANDSQIALSAQQEEINKNKQAAQTVQSQTDYNVKVRESDAISQKMINEAVGQATATRSKADAEAYAIKEKYKAEAIGIEGIQKVLASSPDGYLKYLLYSTWNGQLPTWMTDGSTLPFIDIPASTILPDTETK